MFSQTPNWVGPLICSCRLSFFPFNTRFHSWHVWLCVLSFACMLASHGALEKNRCLATSPGNRFNWPWRWGPGHQDFGEFFAKVVNLGEEEEESIGSPGFWVHQMEYWEWRLGLGDKRVCSHGMRLREDPRTQKQGRLSVLTMFSCLSSYFGITLLTLWHYIFFRITE